MTYTIAAFANTFLNVFCSQLWFSNVLLSNSTSSSRRVIEPLMISQYYKDEHNAILFMCFGWCFFCVHLKDGSVLYG